MLINVKDFHQQIDLRIFFKKKRKKEEKSLGISTYKCQKSRAPKSRGETKLKVSQSQVAELRLGSTLPASNSRKG
jgi:hypothetical protein